MNHQLEFDSIILDFGPKRVLSDIFMKCETGELVGLLGRNGQGKSCLLQVVYGSRTLEKSVRFDKKFINRPFEHPDLLLYLPQFHFIPQKLTLKQIFSDYGHNLNLFLSNFSEFEGMVDLPIRFFSGGEFRLVELYILLKSKTQFLLLDEPFSHISPVQIEKIKQIMNDEKTNKGIILTDHMYKHIIDICDQIYVLNSGKTHFIKTLKEIEYLGYARID